MTIIGLIMEERAWQICFIFGVCVCECVYVCVPFSCSRFYVKDTASLSHFTLMFCEMVVYIYCVKVCIGLECIFIVQMRDAYCVPRNELGPTQDCTTSK